MGSHHWPEEHPDLPEGRFGYLKADEEPRTGVKAFKKVMAELGDPLKEIWRETCTAGGPDEEM